MKKVLILLFLYIPTFFLAQNTYVANPSMGGADLNSGSLISPFATINKALSNMSAGDTCFIREGEYHEEVIINGKNNITIMPYMEEWVVFDGTMPIQSNWITHAGNIYKTTLIY